MASDRSRKNVLLAAACGSSLAPFMVSALIVALPAIGREFSVGPADLGWVTNIFFLSAAVFLVPIGRIADQTGIRRVFTAGITVYIISALLCVLSPDIGFFICARFITGIGAAMVFGTSIALISLVFPESERGKAIGINVTAMAVGFLLGFFLGGILTYYAGWRSILLVTIPFEVIILYIIFSRLKGECEIVRKKEPDAMGSVLYAGALFFGMAGFNFLPHTIGILLLVIGCMALVLFMRRERTASFPLLDTRALSRNRTFVFANLTALIFNTSNFSIIFLVSLYLQIVRGIDVREAGLILLVPIIFMAGLSSFAGKLADRIDPRIVIGAGVSATALSLGILSLISADTPLAAVILALILMGSSIALCQSPLVRTLVTSVPRDIYSLASGMVETMRLAGMTMSIAVSLIVFSIDGIGTPSGANDTVLFLASLREIFTILFVFAAIAFVVTFFVKAKTAGRKITA